MPQELKEEGEFHYVEQGEGPVLVMLHGLFGALSNFEVVLGELAKKYTVVIPMLPLYTLPLLSTNVAALASFLHRFVEYKGWKQVNLLGNSLGGHVALIYCHRHRDLVHSLILTGSSGLYENAFGGGFPRREDYNFIKDKVALTFYDPTTASKELVDECYETVNDKVKLIRILALAKSAIRHNMTKELPEFTLPTLLVWGKQDTITPPEVAEDFHKLMPNSELHWIDKCGHAAMMERPEAFLSIVSPWLQRTVKELA